MTKADPELVLGASTIHVDDASKPPSIDLCIGEKVMLSIQENGFFVEGRRIDSDQQIFDDFRKWLALAMPTDADY